MHVLVYVPLVFLAYQLVNVLINLLFPQKLGAHQAATGPMVSVLIPARDEEANIGALLSSLQALRRDNLEILVLDDASRDRTGQIVQSFAAADPRVQLLRSAQLPPGWLGKNYACHTLALHARGEYLLFVDADVRLQGLIVDHAVAYCLRHRLGLLSLFPVQEMQTWGERCVVPVMNYILLTLLPLVLVRVSPFRAHSAANGQFMLFHAATYRERLPHQRFRGAIAEDIAISRYYKGQRIPVATLTGDPRVRCRMYTSYREGVHGFSKNFFMFFGNQPLLALLFWLLAALGFVPLLLAPSHWLPIYLLGVAATLVGYSLASRLHPLHAMLLFPAHLGTMLLVMGKAIRLRVNRSHSWKGRDIY